jgi:hypothetical protein
MFSLIFRIAQRGAGTAALALLAAASCHVPVNWTAAGRPAVTSPGAWPPDGSQAVRELVLTSGTGPGYKPGTPGVSRRPRRSPAAP